MRYKEFFKDTIFNLIVEVSDHWFEHPDKLVHLETFVSISSIILERFYDSPLIYYKLVLDIKNPDSTRLFSFKVRKLPQDPKIWHVYYLIDDYYLCPDQKYYFTDENGSYIPIVREAFTELTYIFVHVNGYLTFDTSPLNAEKDTSTKYLLYYLQYHEFRHDDSQPNKYYIAQEFRLPKIDKNVLLPLPKQEVSKDIEKKNKKKSLSNNLKSLDLETFLNVKDSQVSDTPSKTNIPSTNTEKTIESTSIQEEDQSSINNADLSLISQLKHVLNHHAPVLSSHPKSYISSFISKFSYDQIPDDQKDNYLKLFPQYIQKEFSNIMESNLSDEKKHTALNKIISEYQTTTNQGLDKKHTKITHYLTTQGKSSQNIPDNTKGLVYTITLPENIPEEITIVRGQPLEVPNKFITLNPSLKVNEMNILRSRLFNLKRVIHNDSMILANAIFLGKTLLLNTVVSSQSLFAFCLTSF